LKSCADHALAPLASGYINEFCHPKEMVKVDKVPEKTCDDDPKLCSTDQLCGQSLTFKSGKAAWRTDNTGYVVEAKRKGLNCGVDETRIVKTAFKNQTFLKRKQIQYALKKLGLYKGAIDALYGAGTETALINFAIDNDFYIAAPEKIFKSLLSQVSAPNSFSLSAMDVVATKSCSRNDFRGCSKEHLCSRGTEVINSRKEWNDNLEAFEAKRKGLSCGVN
jgi:hypothetical protein